MTSALSVAAAGIAADIAITRAISDLGTSFSPACARWQPHKAAKCVEVGDYYLKQGNTRAAISRYQEALEWKPRDAEATYKLGVVLEKTGDLNGALANYKAYLKILPDGPFAAKAQQGITRLKPKVDTAAASAPNPS